MNVKRTSQFLLDKEPGKPDAKLRYRIKWGHNKNIVAFNVGYRVDIAKWSIETQRCKNNTTHGKKKISSNIINREIQRFEQLAESIFVEFEKNNKLPTKEELRHKFNGRNGKLPQMEDDKSFFGIFDEFTKNMGAQNSWTGTTYAKFASIKAHLKDFDCNLSFENLSEETMQKFVQYMHDIPLRNTTIAKHLSFVRWFLRWAYRKGHYSGLLHDVFRPRLKGVDGNSKEVIHLTWDELLHLYSYEIPSPKQYLACVRDVFCFCCFTSLRYSDVAKLRRSDIKDKYISVVTQKTVDGLKIELNDYSREILEKYKDFPFEDNKALPIISNQRMNDYLKELGELAEINEPQRIVYFYGSERYEEVHPKYALLTTHCGRRTFIVNALYLGIPAEVVMKWTGHNDYKAMKPYIKIVDDLKEREMAKFNRKSPTVKKGD
ncbi:MAG: phage integrase SAM-like domain-containing protein [Bacteroidales bacterium]|jgi:integrase|nr:phage integrase SAM-like domain-containing protein [Bacteroidales bacterium]